MGLAALTFFTAGGANAMTLQQVDSEWNPDISAIQTDAYLAKSKHRHHHKKVAHKNLAQI